LITSRVTGEEVDVLTRVLDQSADPPAIDLRSVLLVNREAVKLLAEGEANGSELGNCAFYVGEWVTRAKGRESRCNCRGKTLDRG
jgi:hypothetical protein